MMLRRWSIVTENDWRYLRSGFVHFEFVQVRLIRTPDDTTLTVRFLGLGLSVTKWAAASDWEAA